MENLKYPIGRFQAPEIITSEHIATWIAELETLPTQFRQVAMSLTEQELDTPYRPEGWTLRQVIHHVPDSHANAYIRFKWALTEDSPLIKAYDEGAWAALPDSKLPIEPALAMLESLHQRWVALIRSLDETQLQRTFVHPETKKTNILSNVLGMYVWHGKHHLAHLGLVK